MGNNGQENDKIYLQPPSKPNKERKSCLRSSKICKSENNNEGKRASSFLDLKSIDGLILRSSGRKENKTHSGFF